MPPKRLPSTDLETKDNDNNNNNNNNNSNDSPDNSFGDHIYNENRFNNIETKLNKLFSTVRSFPSFLLPDVELRAALVAAAVLFMIPCRFR